MSSTNRRHNVGLLYKYATASTATAALAGQSLRWSSPLVFNDPFDVPREWEGFTFADLEGATLDRLRAYIRGDATPRSPAAIALVEAIQERQHVTAVDGLFAVMRLGMRLMQKPMERYLDDFRTVWREQLPDLRILCLSTDAGSPAMWAHYAADHTGVVLGLESSDERDSSWLLAEPVIYQDERPNLPTAAEWVRAFLGESELVWDKVLREYQFVKQREWSYEKEFRIVSTKKAEETGLTSDYLFHPEDLRAVILGARIDASDEAKLCAIVRATYPTATVYRAQIDYGERQISHTVAT